MKKFLEYSVMFIVAAIVIYGTLFLAATYPIFHTFFYMAVSFGMTWLGSSGLWVKDEVWGEDIKDLGGVGMLFSPFALVFSGMLAYELGEPWYIGSIVGLVILVAGPVGWVKYRDRNER